MADQENNLTPEVESAFCDEKGFRRLTDDEGRFVANVIDYSGRIYSPFKDFAGRVDQFKQSFPVYDDDIYLLTYPKSGTHWLWEILMMLTRGSAAQREEPKERYMLEGSFAVEDHKEAARPRIISTHLCYEDMPPAIMNNHRGKFIQIHRNPADVAVSFFHHAKKEVKGLNLAYDWDDYITKLFCNQKMMYHSTWFDYTCSWWPCNMQSNFLSVFYEDLKESPVESVAKIAEFVGVPVSKELITDIVANTAFHKMKPVKERLEADALQIYFSDGYSMYRKGEVGDWRNHFTDDQHKQFILYFNEKLKDFPDLKEKLIKYITM